MNAKQYLYSIRDEQKEIEELKDRIYELEMSLLPGAIRYDKDKVQTSPTDQISERMAEAADYSLTLEKKLRHLMQRRNEAQQLIDTLEDSTERQVLDIYFLSVKKVRMDDLGPLMGYSRRQVINIYKRALSKLDEKIALNCTKGL